MVTAAPAKVFTDEMLAYNFRGVDKAFREVHEFMNVTNESIGYLIKKVEKLDKAPSKLKPFLAGAVVGIVALRTLQKRQDQLKRAMDDTGVTETAAQAVRTAKDVAESTAKDLREKL